MMGRMGRWEPDARGRLQTAALDLYSERGYEQTTVAEIAARAGLTERTFFRHFADKREVLFAGSGALQEQLVRALDAAPASLSAIDAIGSALDVVAAHFPASRDYARRRHAIIAANPELQERERIKLASLAAAFEAALRRRGVGGSAAMLAAEMGAAIFRIAFERWIDETHRGDLAHAARESLAELKAVAGG
jgi:AcrR family transcriptional regulator